MTSYINGFSVLPYNDPALAKYTIPGTDVIVSTRKETAYLVVGFLADFHRTVEPLKKSSTASHAYRKIAGSTSWSFHAPGIALDVNWNEHPMGAVGTFSEKQVAQIRVLLKKWSYKGTELFRWGGDYKGRKDEMHFEIIVSRSFALEAIKALTAPPPSKPKPATHKPGSRTLSLTSPRMTGEDVEYVQKWIGKKHCGKADKVYGPNTTRGVKWYQQMRGLKPTGVVDRTTWRHMQKKTTY